MLARNRTMLCPPVEALRRIGVDAAAVSQLIVTHAHYDHIGNLPLFRPRGSWSPTASVAFWTSPLAASRCL